ncbi:MAG: hypothetical protein WKG00_13685 [Polyangiaceae bacterium]
MRLRHLLRRLQATVILGIAVLCTAPATARAENPADVALARELFTEGSRFAEAGNWAAASQRYARSLALKRAAITLYSLGICHKNTGKLVEALVNLRAFLSEPSVPATEPYEAPARAAIAEIEPRIGRVRIDLVPPGVPGAVIALDGVSVPPAAYGMDRPIDPGDHELVGTAPDHDPTRVSLHVPEGSRQQVTVKLASIRSNVLPASLIAGGGAALAGGVIVGLVGVSEASSAPTRDGEEADAARTKMIVGDVIGGVGLAVVVVGVVMLLTAGDEPPPEVGQHASSFSTGHARRGGARCARTACWSASASGATLRW